MKKSILSLLVLVFAFSSSAFAQQRTVTGQVVSADDGEPLPSVTVLLKGTTRGTATDIDGEYSIRVPAEGGTLVFSSVGFQTQEINIGDQNVINVELAADVAQLSEVVVVGFGEQSRRKLTSSVSSVSSDEFEGIQLNTLENALQGNASGVQVTQAGGMLGSPIAVRIRGTASINASSQPLYVVDGVPITTNGGSVGSEISGIDDMGSNPLINLNPDDIASIQVLKDAAASAIYGSRGSNGVVLITTKSGRPGQQQVRVGYSAGITEETGRYDIMNGPQFSRMWNDAGGNFLDVTGLGDLLRGIGFSGNNRELFLNDSAMGLIFGFGVGIPDEDNQPTAPWMDLTHQQGFVQEFSASVSGGNDRTQYYVSGAYDDQEGYVVGDAMDRFNARVKVDHAVSDQVRVGLNIAPSLTSRNRRSERNQVDAPITYAALMYPNVEARNEDGTPNLGIGDNPFAVFPGTPLSNLEGTDITEHLNQVVANANVQWNILPELQFNTDFTADIFELRNQDKRSSITTDGFGVGSAFALYQSFLNYNLNSTLNYTNSWDVHDLSAMVGYSMQRNEETSFDVSGNGFPSDELKTLDSAAEITAGSGAITTYAFQGYLSRITYTYDSKYIITVNGRVDGSSRFGSDTRYGFFPAASVGWIISDEDFWSGLSDVADFLKLRASYGITGNADGIGNFPALGLANVGSNYNGIPGFSPSQVANPELQWEKTTQLDVGLDYGLLNSRLRGSVGYYNKETTELLLNVPISATNGFTSITKNVGGMTNWGVEFDITADILTGPFRWTTSFNISTVENEVTTLVDGEDITGSQQIAREGEPLGAFYLREFAGANPDNGQAVYYVNDEDITQAEIDAGTVFKMENRFGDRYVTESYNRAQRIIAGDPFPDMLGGWRNNFAFKGVDLSFFFQYTIGNELYLGDGGFLRTNLNSVFNQDVAMLDHWRESGDITDIPRPILLTNNGNQSSTRYMVDGSYVRLKNASIGYTLPSNLTRDYQVRFFATGTNLLTFTDDSFWGLDPEVTTAPSNNFGQGNVFFAPAQARTIRFGIDLQF